MTAATLGHPGMHDRKAGGAWGAFALALAMHAALFSLLYFGVRWQTRPAAPVEAELWSEPPRNVKPAPVAAPEAAPEPPKPVVREEPKAEPPPKVETRPDIAIKDEKKTPPKKEDKPKPEPKVEPKKDVKAPTKAEDDPIRRDLLKEEMKRQLAREAQRDEASAKAAAEAAAIGQKANAEWQARVSAKVRSKVAATVADAVPGNPEAQFEVAILPGLEVGGVRLLKSSGHQAYDEAAERAIRAASPFPPPQSDKVTVGRSIVLKMRPKDQ